MSYVHKGSKLVKTAEKNEKRIVEITIFQYGTEAYWRLHETKSKNFRSFDFGILIEKIRATFCPTQPTASPAQCLFEAHISPLKR